MILLAASDNPKWTDIVQAICAGIGFIIVTLTLYKLYLKDKQRQEQIDRLTTLAESNSRIAEQLAAHSEYYKQANTLQQSHIELIKSSIEGDEEFRKKEREIDQKVRKNEIKPILQIRPNVESPGRIELAIFNGGGNAKILKDKIQLSDNLYTPFFHTNLPWLRNGDSVKFTISTKDRINGAKSNFTIFYLDDDGNEYRQDISREQQQGWIISEPVEISQLS